MSILFCSDTHFHHKNVIRYSSRPFSSVEEMNEALINNWNKVVNPGDTVYHLGDFALCSLTQLEKILARLNGEIHIITGNHDKVILQNQAGLIATNRLKSVQQYLEFKYNNYHIVLFHYGCRVWHWSYRGSILLYGHSHGRLPPYGRSMDVGVDSKVITQEYRPVSIEEVLKFIEKQPFGFSDDDRWRKEKPQ